MSVRLPVLLTERPLTAAVRDAALAEGYSALQADVIGRRVSADTVRKYGGVRAVVHPPLRCIPSPALFHGIDAAVARIVRAIDGGERVVIAVDHDADGISSGSVIYTALVQIFGMKPRNVVPMCSHRLNEGYGLSDAFVDRILALNPRPTLVITADQSSADGERVTRLKRENICCVVSDHHAIPIDGLPKDAVACITPLHPDGNFPDPHIAGCGVAWLLMQAVRHRLVAEGRLDATTSSLVPLLDFVSLGSAADAVCVARSPANRAFIAAGLKAINGNARPAWRAMRTVAMKEPSEPVTTETLLFGFAPRTNAGGRLDDAMTGVRLLLASTDEKAQENAAALDACNQERREIEREMRDRALAMAMEQVQRGRRGLTLFSFDWHPGVAGIVASRVVEATGRPTICLSPKLPYQGVLTGSVRTIAGVDVKKALDAIALRIAPGCITGYGGHAGAGGLRVPVGHLEQLESAWDAAVREQTGDVELVPRLEVDGPAPWPPTLDLVDELMALEPYARGFDAPVFTADVEVDRVSPKGDGTHLCYLLRPAGEADADQVEAIHFSARERAETHTPPQVPRKARIAYQITRSTFRGRTKVQVMIRHIEART